VYVKEEDIGTFTIKLELPLSTVGSLLLQILSSLPYH